MTDFEFGEFQPEKRDKKGFDASNADIEDFEFEGELVDTGTDGRKIVHKPVVIGPPRGPPVRRPDRERERLYLVFTTALVVSAVVILAMGTGLLVAYRTGAIGGDDDDEDDARLEPIGTTKPTQAPSLQIDEPEVSPTVSPTRRLQNELFDFLCTSLPAECINLLVEGTAQRQAFQWLQSNVAVEFFTDDQRRTRYALATLFYSTNGPFWTTRTQWLAADLSECVWFTSAAAGTPCDARENFVRLELDGNGLIGTLPAEIALLTKLTSLSIRSSGSQALTGSMPPGFNTLTSLERVSVTGNSFTGGLPGSYGAWTSISELDLSNNGFAGQIPEAFGPFPLAKSINLSGNTLSGAVPGSLFGSTTALETLDLSSNQFTSLPNELATLNGLRFLFLNSNSFTSFPMTITQLPDLLRLDLGNNRITGGIPFEITRLPNIEDLVLAQNDFSGPVIGELGGLVKLQRRLDLSENALTGTIPTQLGRLVELRRLYLNGNSIRGPIPSELAFLREIVEIHFEDTELEGPVPSELCDFYNSQVRPPISFADCRELDETGSGPTSCFVYCCENSDCTCEFLGTSDFNKCFGAPTRK